ncbi:MAG: hypothetical protein GSR77_00290 [Desulfurococcales archaeon]|nr:hypothetical protein [Desulfurococcales archaeon]
MGRYGRPVIGWDTWKRARSWALLFGRDGSQLAELGLRLLNALLDLGYVPPELIAVLELRDKELAEELAKLVQAARHLSEERVVARG